MHVTKEGIDRIKQKNDLAQVVARKSTNQMPAIPAMQRNLQREYVAHLIFILVKGEESYPAQIQTLARHYVRRLASDLEEALRAGEGLDTYSLAHLEECHARLKEALAAAYVHR